MLRPVQSWRSYLRGNKAVWIAVLYAAFSCLWIFLTDKLLARFSLTPAETTSWSIIKGFVYVAITSYVIYLLVRRVQESHLGLEAAVARRTAELAASEEKLRRGEEWLRRLLASLLDVTWTSESDGRTTFISPNVESVYGFSPEEVYENGKELWLGRIHPGDRERVIDSYQALFSRGQRFDEEYRIQCKDGHWMWIHDRAVRTHQKDGMQFADGIFTDITVRKNAEAARDQSEKRYRLLFERNLAGVFRAEAGGGMLECNPALVRILGYDSPAELVGVPTSGILYDPAEEVKLLDVLAREGAINNVEILLRCKDGTSVWGLHNVCFLPPEDGGPPCIEGTVIDISQRKQTEEVLKQQLSLMQAITSTAASGLLMLDTEGRLTFMNPAAEQMFGYTMDELLGKVVHDVCHYKRLDGTPLAQSDCPIAQAYLAGKTLQALEEVHFHKNGTAIHVSVSCAPLLQEGRAVGSVLVMSDITQRRLREEQYKSLQKQFLHAQKMEAIGRLAGGVAHDFNNLVQIINGYADLIADDVDPDTSLAKRARAIKEAGSRAAQLTRQLLAFSRQDAGEPEITPVDQSVTEIVKMARSLIGADIKLTAHLGAEGTCVKIHAGQLEQLVMNLVVNARDAMPAGGAIHIETRCLQLDATACISYGGVSPGPYVLLSVSDTGCGMDAEVRSRIFEPFFTTKERGKGTGLGLSAVYGIATQNGGGVRVESQPQAVTTFCICLPVAERKVYPVIAQADATTTKGTENVLLVEDEDDLRKLISHQLGKLGYRVLEAGNGADALNLAMNTSQTIDLLISDMIMPRMGGQELADRIRTLYPKIRILQMTGYTELRPQMADDQRPGIRYLQKPFTMESLAAAVRHVLDH